jgi:alpha-1,2-mannosyltransferase
VPAAPSPPRTASRPAAVPGSARGRAVARLGRLGPVRWFDAHPVGWQVLGAVVLVAAAWHVINAFLVTYPDEIWQVDLQVYREAAYSIVNGREVYDWLTDAPQYLPFTYPPFAAVLGTPLLLAPFRVVGWIWTGVQLGLLWFCTGLAFRAFLERAGARRGLLQGAVAGLLVQLQPLQDSIRYGQVNAVLVALCLADLVRRREGWWPRGSLVGIAAAIKLTPAVFWVHWIVVRRWRVLAASLTAAVAATVGTALYAPSASVAYWTGAVLDPGRLGPNADTANQSLRGLVLRAGVPDGPLVTLGWAVGVLLVSYAGYRLSARLERVGEPVAVVAAMGMLAFLLSPVSWLHHMWWGVPAIGALLGDGRRTARIAAAVLAGVVLFSRLPWTGVELRGQAGWRHVLGWVDQQAYCWLALAVLAALWWLVARPAERSTDVEAEPGDLTPAGESRAAS